MSIFDGANLDEFLLADIADRIQLSDTEYTTAEQHYRAVGDYLEREGSPLRGLVTAVYAQGSMAIGATITSALDRDEYDIDSVAELALAPQTPPGRVLDLVEQALDGPRYKGRVTRQSRCVTIDFPGMHVDVTPMIRTAGCERTGSIFHYKRENGITEEYARLANPWGFAERFKRELPPARAFYESRGLLARADVAPVPPQTETVAKPLALLAYQLLKRNRNVRYDSRGGRKPPSVFMASVIAQSAPAGVKLSDVLRGQAEAIRHRLALAEMMGQLVDERNPECPEDCFTDRWPGDLAQQALYRRDLEEFIANLNRLRLATTLEAKVAILNRLFGERPTMRVVEALNKRLGDESTAGTLHHRAGSGSVVLGAAAPAILRSAGGSVRPTPRSTDFGGDR